MDRFFEMAVRLSEDSGFLDFQNEVVRVAYDALGQAYSANANEVESISR